MPRKSPSANSKEKESKRLRDLREVLGMSTRELAQEFMVSQTAITLWENGERTIPGSVLKLLEIYEKKIDSRKKKD
jgi:transcriptional regulator with XRE-family HTH domain